MAMDLFQRDLASYERSPLRRVLRLLALLMREQLVRLCGAYCAFYTGSCLFLCLQSQLIRFSLLDALHFFQQFAAPTLPPLLQEVRLNLMNIAFAFWINVLM